MKLKDSVVIHCPQEVVWEKLNDTHLLSHWNPKVKAVVPLSYGSRREGYKYTVTYEMKGKKRPMIAEIVSYKPPEELVIACQNPNFAQKGFVYEAYHIDRHAEGTKLTQVIDLSRSGIPLFWQGVMYLIFRFGKPTGMKYLQRFKWIAEGRM